MRPIDADEYTKYLNKLREICEEYGDLKSATRYQEAINEINKLSTMGVWMSNFVNMYKDI